jgi:hypothetical protein
MNRNYFLIISKVKNLDLFTDSRRGSGIDRIIGSQTDKPLPIIGMT